MSFWTNTRNRIAGMISVTEAYTGLVDPDDIFYRQAVGNENVPPQLSDWQQSRLIWKSRVTYFRSSVGGGIIDALVDRVIGAGIEYKAADKAVQAEVDRFIADPYNDFEDFVPKAARELKLFGKLVLPIFLTPENADVRLGYMNPEQVEQIVWETGNAKRALAILQKRPNTSSRKLLWIVVCPDPNASGRYPAHPALTNAEEPNSVPGMDGNPVVLPTRGKEVYPEIATLSNSDEVQVAGYCFYHRSSCLVSGDGHGIFERVHEWLKALDDFYFGTVRNAILQGSFLWDVTVKGATPEQIKEYQKLYPGPPKPGHVLFHNDEVTWEALSPKLPDSGSIKETLNGILKIIGFAVGLASHEIGAESDVNRNTASENGISDNQAKRFQLELASMLGSWLNYQVDQKQYLGQISEGVDATVEVILPELDATDEGTIATTVKTLVDAFIPAIDDVIVLKQDARKAVYLAMGQDMPAEKDFEKAEQERDEKLPAPVGTGGDTVLSMVNGGKAAVNGNGAAAPAVK